MKSYWTCFFSLMFESSMRVRCHVDRRAVFSTSQNKMHIALGWLEAMFCLKSRHTNPSAICSYNKPLWKDGSSPLLNVGCHMRPSNGLKRTSWTQLNPCIQQLLKNPWWRKTNRRNKVWVHGLSSYAAKCGHAQHPPPILNLTLIWSLISYWNGNKMNTLKIGVTALCLNDCVLNKCR